MDYTDTTSSQKQYIVNNKMYARNVPSQHLQPYLNARPALTKYSKMPIVDPRMPFTVPLNQMSTYNVSTTFSPATDTAPWSGFATNINTESDLRGQVYARQHNSQAVYVPSSQSDLYSYNWVANKPIVQPFPDLFDKPRFQQKNPNPANLGNYMFNNCTQQQVKDLTGKSWCS